MRQQCWVLIAFHNALWQLLYAPPLETGVIDTLMRGGDADTNSAIAGALLGAVHGREAIPNQMGTVFAKDPPGSCQVRGPTSSSAQTATPTDTPTPVPTSTDLPPVTGTSQIGLDLTPAHVVILVDAAGVLSGDSAALDALRSQVVTKFAAYQGRRVGLVIALGYHQNIADGVRLAKRANQILQEVYPQIFGGAVAKPFWYSTDTNDPEGTIAFEFYFFTTVNGP